MTKKRNPQDGVSLAAIVAKETTNGAWSGSGGGIGLGSGGPGVFIGGMAGTKHEQTQRATEFSAPEKPEFSLVAIFRPAIAFIIVALLSTCAMQMADSPNEDVPATNGDAGLANLVHALGDLIMFAPVICVVGLVIWFVFFFNNSMNDETKRYDSSLLKYEIREKIYYRLRYIESEHVVFDPVTMEEAQAHQIAIKMLINRISQSESVRN